MSIVFGSYTLPAGITLQSDSHGSNIATAQLARTDGARQPPGYLTERKWTLRGSIYKPIGSTDLTLVRTAVDALRGALKGQGPTTLQFDTDRFFRNVQVGSFSDNYSPTAYNRMVDVDIELTSGDPFQYETASQLNTYASPTNGQSITITPGGNAPTPAVFSLTVAATGNLAFNISGTAEMIVGAFNAGDVIIVDGLNHTVTVAGVNRMLTFDGLFPALAQGSNTFTINWTVGAGYVGLSSFAVAYNRRWY